MFPEYRELITQLKTSDHHFANLFDKHNALDHQIKAMETQARATTANTDGLEKSLDRVGKTGPGISAVNTALVALGTQPASTDWINIFEGEIDDAFVGSGCHELSGSLRIGYADDHPRRHGTRLHRDDRG